MASDFGAIGEALRQWIITSTGLKDAKVIFADQAATRPQPPYAIIKPFPGIRRIGAYDEERLTDEPGIINRIGQRRLTVSVNIWGPGAIAMMEAAQDGLERYDVMDGLEAAGLAPWNRGESKDLTGLMETNYEERAQIDVVFGYTSESEEDVSYIATVEYEGQYNAGGDPPINIETSGTIGV